MMPIQQPPRIAQLPKVGGEPELWYMQHTADEAIEKQVCYCCGGTFGNHKAFALGPKEVMDRIPAAPPSHTECLLWAISVDAIGDPIPLLGGVEPKILCAYVTDVPWDPVGQLSHVGSPTSHTWFVDNHPVKTDEALKIVIQGCAVDLARSLVIGMAESINHSELHDRAERYRWVVNNMMPELV